MRNRHRHPLLSACAALLLCGYCAPLRADIAGPDSLPDRLSGLWRISLCVGHGHSWIRLQNTETGEVHTLARYVKGCGGESDWRQGRRTWPGAPACGVIWDQDLKFEVGVRRDGRIIRSCYVRDPCIYRGRMNGYGHCVVRMNCVTYARDAWCHYSGEWYDLPPVALPCGLEAAVCGKR
jgi:hypothetical protein